jgi:Uma2 family endonuclease
MAEPALRRMTLDDFLTWEDGTDTRYELIGGFVVAMAPPAPVHSALVTRLGVRIDTAPASRRPCTTYTEAGILRQDRADSLFVADIAVSCGPIDPRKQWVDDPILVIEILSPSTERHDRRFKVPVYREIETVQEVLLVGSDTRYAELHQRTGEQWIVEILRGPGDTIRLSSVGAEIPLAELYDGIVFDEQLAG